jgi:hypothetical protein
MQYAIRNDCNHREIKSGENPRLMSVKTPERRNDTHPAVIAANNRGAYRFGIFICFSSSGS